MTNFTLGMKDLLVAVSMIWRTSLNRELSSNPMNTTLCEQPRTDEQKPSQHEESTTRKLFSNLSFPQKP
jgi:hypothetical protein